MTPLLQQIGSDRLVAFFLVLARVSPLFVLAPMFSSKLVPPRVRSVVAVALAVGLSPIVSKGKTMPTELWTLVGLIGKEVLVGLAFAYALAALMAAISVAGSFLDTLIGFSFGSLLDPITGTNSAILQQLYGMVAVLVFIAIGGDGWALQGLVRTYETVPIDGFPALGSLVAGANHLFVTVFASAIEVAGPVMLAMLITDAGFGLVSRVVPQLNVFGVAFPAKVAAGLLLIGVSLPFVAGWSGDALQNDLRTVLDSLRTG